MQGEPDKRLAAQACPLNFDSLRSSSMVSGHGTTERSLPAVGGLQSRQNRSALSLITVVVAICATGFSLFLLVGWTTTLQGGTKQDLARRMLADLDQALVRYRRATGSYPTSRGPDSAIPAVVDLMDHEKTRPILEAFPSCLRSGPGTKPLVDPWGTPLRYLPENSGGPAARAGSGRPVFVSAGPDRDFGDQNPVARENNLRSDDLDPDGLQIHQVIRDALAEQEQQGGQEGDQ